VVNLFISPSLGVGTPNVKELQKEVQVHKALKNQYILEFLHSEILDREKEREGFKAGLYLLLELAVGGDLFDKIGELSLSLSKAEGWEGADKVAPDVGIPEELAKFYFAQLCSGMVRFSANDPKRELICTVFLA
jgi:serine/threonine-protein kinase Chk1